MSTSYAWPVSQNAMRAQHIKYWVLKRPFDASFSIAVTAAQNAFDPKSSHRSPLPQSFSSPLSSFSAIEHLLPSSERTKGQPRTSQSISSLTPFPSLLPESGPPTFVQEVVGNIIKLHLFHSASLHSMFHLLIVQPLNHRPIPAIPTQTLRTHYFG
jgi:hypothetical protein